MPYAMRRKRQQMDPERAREALGSGFDGVLSVIDADGEPYGVPLNYVLVGDTVYFHSAPEGRKVDAARLGRRGSFCVVAHNEVSPEKFTSLFVSVIAEGPLRIVTDEDERREALLALALRCNPDLAACEAEVASGIARCCMIALDLDQVTGKECIEFVRRREGE